MVLTYGQFKTVIRACLKGEGHVAGRRLHKIWLEAVSKPQIRFSDKAQVDEKTQHTWA